MFNTFCWCLNVVRLSYLAAALRYLAFQCLPKRAWTYNAPVAGYKGGVDVPLLGTVAFQDERGALVFRW